MSDKERVHYYIQTQQHRFDGNDCCWLTQDQEPTYDLKKAGVFSKDEAFEILNKGEKLKSHPAHEINSIIQFHVPLTQIIKKTPAENEKCYLVCTRDTCGKNATFWCWDHSGYSSDTRAAQVFTYKKDVPETDREIDVLVPVSHVNEKIQFRIDMQDLGKKRKLTHVMDRDFFNEE